MKTNANLISWFDVDSPTTEIGFHRFIVEYQMRWGKKPEKILISYKDFEQFSRNLEARNIYFGSKREMPVTSVNLHGVEIEPTTIIARGVATAVRNVPQLSQVLRVIEEVEVVDD